MLAEKIQNRNKDPIHSFESFSSRSAKGRAVRNNFHLFFHPEGDVHRRKLVYERCVWNIPGFASKAEQLMGRYARDDEDLMELYEMYRLMHPFADSNAELFT